MEFIRASLSIRMKLLICLLLAIFLFYELRAIAVGPAKEVSAVESLGGSAKTEPGLKWFREDEIPRDQLDKLEKDDRVPKMVHDGKRWFFGFWPFFPWGFFPFFGPFGPWW
ncbi:hypothetical protein ACOME3_001745 [Neoechinorhynchus agilis]